MNNILNETFEFGEILALTTEALLRSETIIKSPRIQGQTKDWVRRTMINRFAAVKNEILAILPDESKHILKQDILTHETALQFREVKNLFLSLSPDDRDKVENFLVSLQKQAA